MHCSGTYGSLAFIITVILITSRFETECRPAIIRRDVAKDYETEIPEYEVPRPLFTFPSFIIPVSIPNFKDYHSDPHVEHQTAPPDYYDYISNSSAEVYDFFGSSRNEQLDYFEPDKELMQIEDGAAAQHIQNETSTTDSPSTTITVTSNSNGTHPSGRPLLPYASTTSRIASGSSSRDDDVTNFHSTTLQYSLPETTTKILVTVPGIYPGLLLPTSPRGKQSTSEPVQFNHPTSIGPQSSNGLHEDGVTSTKRTKVRFSTTVLASESAIPFNAPLHNYMTSSNAHEDNSESTLTMHSDYTRSTASLSTLPRTLVGLSTSRRVIEIPKSETTSSISNIQQLNLHLQPLRNTTHRSAFSITTFKPTSFYYATSSLSQKHTDNTMQMTSTTQNGSTENMLNEMNNISPSSDQEHHKTLNPSEVSMKVASDHDTTHLVDHSTFTTSISEEPLQFATTESSENALKQTPASSEDSIPLPGEDVIETPVSPSTEDDIPVSEKSDLSSDLPQDLEVTPYSLTSDLLASTVKPETNEARFDVVHQTTVLRGLDDNGQSPEFETNHNEATLPTVDPFDFSTESNQFHPPEEPPDRPSSEFDTITITTNSTIENTVSMTAANSLGDSNTFTDVDNLSQSSDPENQNTVNPSEMFVTGSSDLLDKTISLPGEGFIEAPVSPSTEGVNPSPFNEVPTLTTELNNLFAKDDGFSETPDLSTDVSQDLEVTSFSLTDDLLTSTVETETNEAHFDEVHQTTVPRGLDDNGQSPEFETDLNAAALPTVGPYDVLTESNQFQPSEDPPDTRLSSILDTIRVESTTEHKVSVTANSQGDSNIFTHIDHISSSDLKDQNTLNPSEMFVTLSSEHDSGDLLKKTLSLSGEDFIEAPVSRWTEEDIPVSQRPDLSSDRSQDLEVTPFSLTDDLLASTVELATNEARFDVVDQRKVFQGFDDNGQSPEFETDHNEATSPTLDRYDVSTDSMQFHLSEGPPDRPSSEFDTITTESLIENTVSLSANSLDDSNIFTHFQNSLLSSDLKDQNTVKPSEMLVTVLSDQGTGELFDKTPVSPSTEEETPLSEKSDLSTDASPDWEVTPLTLSDEPLASNLEPETNQALSDVVDQTTVLRGLDDNGQPPFETDHNETTIQMVEPYDVSTNSNQLHPSGEPPDKPSPFDTITTEFTVENTLSLTANSLDESNIYTDADNLSPSSDPENQNTINPSEMLVTVSSDHDSGDSWDDSISLPGEDVIEAPVSPSTEVDTPPPFNEAPTLTSEMNGSFDSDDDLSEKPDRSSNVSQDSEVTPFSMNDDLLASTVDPETNEARFHGMDQTAVPQGIDVNGPSPEFETIHNEATMVDPYDVSTDSNRFHPSEEPPDRPSSEFDTITTDSTIENEVGLTADSLDESNIYTDADNLSPSSDTENQSTINPSEMLGTVSSDHDSGDSWDNSISLPGEDVIEAPVSPSTEDATPSLFNEEPPDGPSSEIDTKRIELSADFPSVD